jgi:hypothetical protein
MQSNDFCALQPLNDFFPRCYLSIRLAFHLQPTRPFLLAFERFQTGFQEARKISFDKMYIKKCFYCLVLLKSKTNRLLGVVSW